MGEAGSSAGLKSLCSARTDVLTNHHISPFFISSACYTHLQIYVTPPHTHTHTHTHTHKPYMLVCHNLRYMVLSQSPTTFLCLITCLCIISPMFHSLYYLLVSHNLCYMVLAYSIHYKFMSHSLHSMVLSHTFLCHIASTTCSCPMPFLHCKI